MYAVRVGLWRIDDLPEQRAASLIYTTSVYIITHTLVSKAISVISAFLFLRYIFLGCDIWDGAIAFKVQLSTGRPYSSLFSRFKDSYCISTQ